MPSMMSRLVPSAPLLLSLAACGGGADGSGNPASVAPDIHAVGGTVSGLSGTGLVLRNNGGDDLRIAANGEFTFATALPTLATYSITVATQPGGQTCAVSGGSGTVGSAAVRNIAVSCGTDIVPLFVDDFERPDQQGLGRTPEGYPWMITGPAYLKASIKDGRYVSGVPAADGNVSYAGILTSQPALRFGGRYSFVPSGTGGGRAPLVALISSNDTVFTLKRMVHLIASRSGVALTWWQENDQDNVPAQCTGATLYTAPLPNDGTAYPLYMTIRGDTVTVDKPDGTQLVCTDPHFSQLAGNLSIWELAYGSEDGDVPRWDKAEAFIEAIVR